MDHREFKSFPAKILLFGEHTVVHGSHALAIPYPKMGMQFQFLEQNNELHIHLVNLCNYLKKLSSLHYKYDLDQFEKDLSTGLNVISTIPIGYGAGSSGALVACFFDAYCENYNGNTDQLKLDLASIESYFHGKSSGIDPLVSYLNQSIIIDHGNVELRGNIPFDKEELFILDSQLSRSTEDYVNLFKEKILDAEFEKTIQECLVPMNNKAIKNYLSNESIWESFESISRFQLEQMVDFIPSDIQEIWKDGLATNQYLLKLCGAGGGGFFLGLKQKNMTINQDIELLNRIYTIH